MSKKVSFKKVELENSSWITNFWYLNNKLFLTQSLFDDEQNLLGYLTIDDLKNNFTPKSVNKNFLNHPNPMTSSALEASLTSVIPIIYPIDFIYNMIFENNKYYLAMINFEKTAGYTLVYDLDFNLEDKIDDYLIIGKIENQLVFLNFITKQTFFLSNKSFLNYSPNKFIKILNFETFDLLINDKQIYQRNFNGDINLVYSNDKMIKVSKFNEQTIIISCLEKQETFSLSILDWNITKTIIDEYFFCLESIEATFLIGKPFFLEHRYEDYELPLMIII